MDIHKLFYKLVYQITILSISRLYDVINRNGYLQVKKPAMCLLMNQVPHIWIIVSD